MILHILKGDTWKREFTWSRVHRRPTCLLFVFLEFFEMVLVHQITYFTYFDTGSWFYSWVSNGVVGSPAFAAYDQGLYNTQLVYMVHWLFKSVNLLMYMGFPFISRVWCFSWKLAWVGFERPRGQKYLVTPVSCFI